MIYINKNIFINNSIFDQMIDLQKERRKILKLPSSLTNLMLLENIEGRMMQSLVIDCPTVKDDQSLRNELNLVTHYWFIPKSSVLYLCLKTYFKINHTNCPKVVRGYLEDNCGLFFISGENYDYISADLFGGKADGSAKKKFLDFVKQTLYINQDPARFQRAQKNYEQVKERKS